MNEEEQMKIVLDIADHLRGFEIAHSVFQGSCQKLFGYGMTRKEILELVMISEMAHQERQPEPDNGIEGGDLNGR